MRKIILIIILILVIALVMTSCSSSTKPIVKQVYALDTINEFSLYTDENIANKVIDEIKEEISKYEEMFSVSSSGDIAKLNEADGKVVNVSDETKDVITKSLEVSKETNGAFDITVFPIVKLWGFDSKNYKVPSDNEIEDALKYVDYKKVEVVDNKVSLDKGMKIDLGAIAKGYICEKLISILKDNEIKSAIINNGGNVYTLGVKPNGSEYKVGIQDPNDESSYFATVTLSNMFAITSGAYQRNFTNDNKTYHHIMDSKTGKPANSDISSVTIFGKDGALCDAYSTAFYVMGIDKSLEFYSLHNDIDFVILNKDCSQMYVSKNIADKVEISNSYIIKKNVIKKAVPNIGTAFVLIVIILSYAKFIY